MPAAFLTAEQRDDYGRFCTPPKPEALSQYFHLSESDKALLEKCRGSHNRLGYALQLTTVRYLGAFLGDPSAVPSIVLKTLGQQLGIVNLECIELYRDGERRWDHAAEIRKRGGYRDFTDPSVAFPLTYWLFVHCWMGNDRPIILFDRATHWMHAHKVLLPGASLLERFVVRIQLRADARLYRIIGQEVGRHKRAQLESLLVVPEGERTSVLDQLRNGPTRVSGPALVQAIHRLQTVRGLGIQLPARPFLPPARIASLARFTELAKTQSISRLSPEHRLACLVAFTHCLEASAHDEAIEVLDTLLRDLFRNAERAQHKVRLRSLKDLDQAAGALAEACRIVLVHEPSAINLQNKIFDTIPKATMQHAVEQVTALIRPPDDVFFNELATSYRSVRRYLPTVLKYIHFGSNPAGAAVVIAWNWLGAQEEKAGADADPPRAVISKSWERYVLLPDGAIDRKAYVFCVLDQLHSALKRRDVFVSPSRFYADPRAGLLDGHEWETTRPTICRMLGLTTDPKPVLAALAADLDQTFRRVVQRLPNNPDVRFEIKDGKQELILTPLDKLEEPTSLIELREAVAARMPMVDLPEIFLEINQRTKFTEAFTHISESETRASDLDISLCAVLISEACNTGIEPLIRPDAPALHRDRLLWTSRNYIRSETLAAANVCLVEAQNQISLAHVWGGGDVASADGLRFVVPVKTVHAGPNPKYFGAGRGVTWYNLVSDQFTGLNAITVPGTLRDSLVLLSVLLEQKTPFRPTLIHTDTGAYSDVIFGLFRLLGYHFCPRLADIGGTRLWRIDPDADYGPLNSHTRHYIDMDLVEENWNDILRLVGSLKLGRISADAIMRTLQVGDKPTRLAQAIAAVGRIDKTKHTLNYIDDKDMRRGTLLQLNRGECRHTLGRENFHGKRGELRQHYREGQEDQLCALGMSLNIIAHWNTLYIEAATTQLRAEGYHIQDEDLARLSPLIFKHINFLGKYSFHMSDTVRQGGLRPLRKPQEAA